MVRALGAYYVVGDGAIDAMRRRSWSFAGIATAGNVAARSGRSLGEIARSYEQSRNWTRVAQEAGISPGTLYLALNGPRAVTAGDLEEDPDLLAPSEPREGSFSPSRRRTPAPNGRNARERVAGARMEFVEPRPGVLLRRIIGTYYGLPDARLRSLEATGWTLAEILVAGNLSVRSEFSFEEILALRSRSRDWPEVARRSGVRQTEIYQPTIPRRVGR
jgi:hypothetical protein